MIDLLIEEVAVTMAVGAPDRNGARRRSTFAVQFVQGIQEAIEFLLEQLQLGLHQATPRSGDVLPLSAEKRPWRCPATLRSGDVLPPSEAEMQQRQQHNGNSHGISDSNNDSNTSRRQRQQQP